MSRNLIDRDRLKKEIHEEDIMGGLNYAWYIDHAELVDAVEVVRCRDCKWWVKQKVGGVCQLNFLLATSDNWFCADGERRTMDELISYFNQEVSKMDISQENKMALLGMITAIGYESKKQEVVRCKDCKYRFVDGDEVLFNCCELNYNKVQSDDWFCADGERRE